MLTTAAMRGHERLVVSLCRIGCSPIPRAVITGEGAVDGVVFGL